MVTVPELLRYLHITYFFLNNHIFRLLELPRARTAINASKTDRDFEYHGGKIIRSHFSVFVSS
jgi:hypothetical protein